MPPPGPPYHRPRQPRRPDKPKSIPCPKELPSETGILTSRSLELGRSSIPCRIGLASHDVSALHLFRTASVSHRIASYLRFSCSVGMGLVMA